MARILQLLQQIVHEVQELLVSKTDAPGILLIHPNIIPMGQRVLQNGL
jgi:hypothetical protein